MEKDTRIILISGLSIVLVTGVIFFLKYKQGLSSISAGQNIDAQTTKLNIQKPNLLSSKANVETKHISV